MVEITLALNLKLSFCFKTNPLVTAGDKEYMSTVKIKLSPVKHNRRAVLRGMSRYTIRRENKVTIITIQIGNETLIVEVPP